MPTSKKRNTAPAPVKNRGAAIRKSHQNQAAVADARDVARFGFDPLDKPAQQTTALDISRAPERGQALELAQQLQTVVVTDKASYQRAKELYAAAKQIDRKMTEHWQRITRSIDTLKQTIFGFRDDDKAALLAGMQRAQGIILAFENAENERVRRAEEAQREERERKAKADRERELDAAEDKALELEQQSENLSARELWFVERVAGNDSIDPANPTAANLKVMMTIASQGGYKDVDNQVARLLRSPKILAAIQAKRDAAAIREQAQAKREQPLDIMDAPPVESAITRGRGLPPTKTYYSCEVIDANKLREAFLNGEVPADALIPNEVYLNAQARAAKSAEIFERAFPGCQLKKRQSI